MIWATIFMAFREIRRNGLRSFLTMLGVVIGVGAVIALVSVGRGATAKVTEDIGKLGKNLLTVSAGSFSRGGGGTGLAAGEVDRIGAGAVHAAEREQPAGGIDDGDGDRDAGRAGRRETRTQRALGVVGSKDGNEVHGAFSGVAPLGARRGRNCPAPDVPFYHAGCRDLKPYSMSSSVQWLFQRASISSTTFW